MLFWGTIICIGIPKEERRKQQKKYDEALKLFDEAIKIMEETAKLKGLTPARVASCYGNICSLYFNKNDYDRAREYYKKAKSVPNGNWKYEYLRKKLGFQN